MNLLLVNLYDHKTVRSNPGLMSLLRVLDRERVGYSITVSGKAEGDGLRCIELPASQLAPDSGHVDALLQSVSADVPTHVVAIDPEGAALATQLLQRFGRSDVRRSYICYEILFREEVLTREEEWLKEVDQAFLKTCRHVLIQDEARGRMFCAETGLTPLMHYAPIAPLQYLGRNAASASMRSQFGLPADKRILVYSGSLSPYAKPDWWVAIAETLPDDYLFLLTCYDAAQMHDPNLARIWRILTHIGNTRIFGRDLPYDDYLQLLRVCDTGLVLFRPVYTHWMNGRNIRQIGLSSGKFGNYISCGLPVICDSDQETFKALGEHYPAVQTIGRPDEVLPRLQWLVAQQSATDAECRRLFEERLNPAPGIRSFIDGLRSG